MTVFRLGWFTEKTISSAAQLLSILEIISNPLFREKHFPHWSNLDFVIQIFGCQNDLGLSKLTAMNTWQE